MSKKDLYAFAAALVAIASVVFTAVGLPIANLCIGLAILSIIVVVWRQLEHAPLLDPIQAVATVVFLFSAALIIVSAVSDDDEKNRSAPDPQHEASQGEIIRIYNKVTSGPRMREDDKVVFLTTKPVAFCSERNCNIPGTRRETGGTYDAAVCQRQGEEITNGQDTSRLDDHTPGLFHSSRYYGVRLDENTFGYVSEVWVNPKDRGGLGLPRC